MIYLLIPLVIERCDVMGLPELTVKDVKEMFLYVSEQLKQNKEFLNKADRAIGDGDHGVGMARGFEAVRQKLEGESYQNISEVLKAIGMTLLTSIGGASGVVFGTLFIGGAKRIGDQTSFNSRSIFSV